MKIILSSAIILFTTPSFATAGCEEFAFNGEFPATAMKAKIICKNGFAIGYSAERKTLLWTAHRIDKNTNFIIDDRVAFHKDRDVPFDRQSANSDFIGTGYDKGHMVPFEDMSFSKESAYDSMSLTNIVPQNYSNNRGGWKSLEGQARKMAKYGPVYVVSGPIFEGQVDYVGNKIPIPSRLFKVIITNRSSKTYILPNMPVSAYEVKNYVTTRAQLKQFGIDVTPSVKLAE